MDLPGGPLARAAMMVRDGQVVPLVPWWRRALTHEEYRRTRSFAGLDGLRAVAAVIVVIFHFGGPVVRPLQGWVGVQVFFALSGFLITTLALREVGRTGRLDFRAFYLRRFFRIVPVYLVVLGIVVLQVEINGAGREQLRAALPYYLTFLNDIAPHAAYVHTWTLGIEQKFYLLWPLLAFALVGRTRGRLIAGVATIAVLLPLWDVRWLHSSSFVVLLLGALVAIVMDHPRGFAVLRPLLTPVGSVAVAVGFVAFHLQFTGLLERFGEPRMIPVYGLALCLLLPVVIGPGPVRWLLSRRPMVFVGQRSYSIYLVQFLAAAATAGLFPRPSGSHSPGMAVVTCVVSLLFADLLYRWVEQPMIAFGKRVSRRRASGATSAPVPTVEGAPMPDRIREPVAVSR